MRVSEKIGLYFSLPLLISGVYGMNVPLPFQESKHFFLFYAILCTIWVVYVRTHFD